MVFLLAACSGVGTSDVVTTLATTSTTTATSTTSAPPTATDIYASVSPALAFVHTPVGSGSAILIDHTTLVTNAHVVWPSSHVAISFPGGAGGTVPVTGYDWMADIALLDVTGVANLPSPVTFAADVVAPGNTVYLVGYPADNAGSAAPAITAGIVSRLRSWPEAGLTFTQSDALISGGQSGGALVDERGRVVGISGLSIGDGFALALTAADLVDRVERIRAKDGGELGGRAVADLTGPPTSEGSVPFVLDEVVFVFDGSAGQSVAIEITGSEPLNADLVGPDGFVEAVNVAAGTVVLLEAELVLDGPHFVVVYPESEPIGSVRISGIDARSWTDPDHGRSLEVGTRLAGMGDYPGDLDWFSLDLVAGQRVTITVTSINIDASILVDLLVPVDDTAFASDSDSAGGVLGLDARLDFTAPATGTYAVAVFDETGFGPGGYIIAVEEHRE